MSLADRRPRSMAATGRTIHPPPHAAGGEAIGCRNPSAARNAACVSGAAGGLARYQRSAELAADEQAVSDAVMALLLVASG